MQEEGDPTLLACTLRDHAADFAAGVYVDASAVGMATIGPDCVFARNSGGDVVRDGEGGEEEEGEGGEEAEVKEEDGGGGAFPSMSAGCLDR